MSSRRRHDLLRGFSIPVSKSRFICICRERTFRSRRLCAAYNAPPKLRGSVESPFGKSVPCRSVGGAFGDGRKNFPGTAHAGGKIKTLIPSNIVVTLDAPYQRAPPGKKEPPKLRAARQPPSRFSGVKRYGTARKMPTIQPERIQKLQMTVLIRGAADEEQRPSEVGHEGEQVEVIAPRAAAYSSLFNDHTPG